MKLTLWAYYDHSDVGYINEELNRLVGRQDDGSGADLEFGTRDVSWSFSTVASACAAFQRLARDRRLLRVELQAHRG